ncbi:unnamed protein product [Staurois parvus]|uniref:Selenoprotein O n=1 Tax=Staurois parvus TaxID=386267 RepID=A0ABN9CTK3_9NEOB|nr:unnamed protein product [Staurois parvus]
MLNKWTESGMLLSIAVIYLWTLWRTCCLAWTAHPILSTKNIRPTFLQYALNSSDHCVKKVKVSSMNLWSVSVEDVLGELPVDLIKKNYLRKVKDCIFSYIYPTPFASEVQLVAFSEDVLDGLLDLDSSVANSVDFLQFVSGSKTVPGFVPLAHRYGGHQFGIWAGQLGDGRAHLIATYINRFGERWELQLKGSGKNTLFQGR